MSECVHQPSANPRHDGWCVKCGHKLPEPEPTRRRNPLLEREIIEHASGQWDADTIISHAQIRSAQLAGEYVQDAYTIRTRQDWLKETRAELADAANYLAWWLEERLESEDLDARARIQQALGAVVAAYELTKED